MEEKVILVDKNDNSIGKIGKIEAHQKVFYIGYICFYF